MDPQLNPNVSPQPQSNVPVQSSKTWLVWVVIGLVLVGAGVFGYVKYVNKKEVKGTNTVTKETQNEADNDAFKYEATISVDANSFTPSTLKVKPETRVYWESKDSTEHKIVASPSAKNPSDQFTGDIPASGGHAFSFTKEGTYSYYDAKNPSNSGTIIVTKD